MVPADTSSPVTALSGSNVRLYLLDFNQVRYASMDEEGVKALVDAFRDNDPYFPKPLAEEPRDEALWVVFRDAYLERSRLLAVEEETPVWAGLGLPQKFIDGVVGRRNAGRGWRR